jgi:hypothetical protein
MIGFVCLAVDLACWTGFLGVMLGSPANYKGPYPVTPKKLLGWHSFRDACRVTEANGGGIQLGFEDCRGCNAGSPTTEVGSCQSNTMT